MVNDDRGVGAESRGSRRGALTAMLAGSALGLAALGGAPPQAAAKGKKGKKGKKHRQPHRNDSQGHGGKEHGGKGHGGKGGVGAALPSLRFVETTTTFDSSGVVSAVSKCPAGYLPIGGGFFSSIESPVLLTSMPQLAENDWLIEVNGAQVSHQMTVTAICLAASDDTEDEDTIGESRGDKKRKRSRKR